MAENDRAECVRLGEEYATVKAERDDYANRLRETDRAYTDVAAERDRLRQELDLTQPASTVRAWRPQLEGRFHKALRKWSPADVSREAMVATLIEAVGVEIQVVDVLFGFDGSRSDATLVAMVMPSGHMVELERLRHELAGAMAAIAVAVDLPVGHDPDELIEALAGVVAEREELRGDLAMLRARVDDIREAVRALFPTLVVGSDG